MSEQNKSPRLIHLVIERLKEEFGPYNVDSVYRNMAMNTLTPMEAYDLYINHTFIAEVTDTEVHMWIPMVQSEPNTMPEKVCYSAADPKFFYHVVGTAKLIIQRFQDDVDVGLRDAKYFGLES